MGCGAMHGGGEDIEELHLSGATAVCMPATCTAGCTRAIKLQFYWSSLCL